MHLRGGQRYFHPTGVVIGQVALAASLWLSGVPAGVWPWLA